MICKMNYAETNSFAGDVKILLDEYQRNIQDLAAIFNEIETSSQWVGVEKDTFVSNVNNKYMPPMKQVYDESLKYIDFMNKEVSKYVDLEEQLLARGKEVIS